MCEWLTASSGIILVSTESLSLAQWSPLIVSSSEVEGANTMLRAVMV